MPSELGSGRALSPACRRLPSGRGPSSMLVCREITPASPLLIKPQPDGLKAPLRPHLTFVASSRPVSKCRHIGGGPSIYELGGNTIQSVPSSLQRPNLTAGSRVGVGGGAVVPPKALGPSPRLWCLGGQRGTKGRGCWMLQRRHNGTFVWASKNPQVAKEEPFRPLWFPWPGPGFSYCEPPMSLAQSRG